MSHQCGIAARVSLMQANQLAKMRLGQHNLARSNCIEQGPYTAMCTCQVLPAEPARCESAFTMSLIPKVQPQRTRLLSPGNLYCVRLQSIEVSVRQFCQANTQLDTIACNPGLTPHCMGHEDGMIVLEGESSGTVHPSWLHLDASASRSTIVEQHVHKLCLQLLHVQASPRGMSHLAQLFKAKLHPRSCQTDFSCVICMQTMSLLQKITWTLAA